MKHLIPALALTTLAAASAQAAGQGLSYDYVSFSFDMWSNTNVDGHANGYSVSAQTKLGSSNFLIGGRTTVGSASNTSAFAPVGNGQDSAYVGYLFSDVGGFADVTVSVASDEVYSVKARKSLGRGFEAGLGYARVSGENRYEASVGYALTKNLSLDYSYSRLAASWPSAGSYAVLNTIGLRYNF